MVLKNFIFGKSNWHVSSITNCRIDAQFVINALKMVSLTKTNTNLLHILNGA
jgi:hypothetical protein